MFRTGATIFLVGCVIIPFSNAITGPVAISETNITASGSGSEMWVGSGFNSIDYCGQDTNGSQADINPDSITRLPISIWVMAEVGLLSLVFTRQAHATSASSQNVPSSFPFCHLFLQSTGRYLPHGDDR